LASKRNFKIYVHGPGAGLYMQMFAKRDGYSVVTGLDAADAIVFTGGSDVNPALYRENPLPETSFDRDRDDADIEAFLASEGKFRIGICRGGQFLNVMSGGRLWQDVNNHGLYGHHDVLDIETQKISRCTSTHHQEMIPGPNGKVLCTAKLATTKKSEKVVATGDMLGPDIEAVWYPSTRSLCFQPHPEYSNAGDTPDLFFSLMDRYVL
jgi:gamma-glutamyl-gamma-aminobutyrate hydrolase PuuD